MFTRSASFAVILCRVTSLINQLSQPLHNLWRCCAH